MIIILYFFKHGLLWFLWFFEHVCNSCFEVFVFFPLLHIQRHISVCPIISDANLIICLRQCFSDLCIATIYFAFVNNGKIVLILTSEGPFESVLMSSHHVLPVLEHFISS